MVVDTDAILAQLRPSWRGARVFVTLPAAKRHWRRERREPDGAAERLARDIERAVLDAGGTEEHVDRVLLACLHDRIDI